MWLLNGNNECLDISLDVKKWQYVSKLLKTLPINSEEMSYVRTCKEKTKVSLMKILPSIFWGFCFR